MHVAGGSSRFAVRCSTWGYLADDFLARMSNFLECGQEIVRAIAPINVEFVKFMG